MNPSSESSSLEKLNAIAIASSVLAGAWFMTVNYLF